MILPYQKCKCCGKRIGFKEWLSIIRILGVEVERWVKDENISYKEAVDKVIETIHTE